MESYAKVIVMGSPITKSNFKLHNSTGRAILPYNSGSYNDRYGIYEHEIAYTARSQNPDKVLSESLIAILKVYYKSEKRHPDTINITKSIFDGIEKSGLIVNDAQIVKIITEEYYDSENPRFELELFGASSYNLNFSIEKKDVKSNTKEYSSLKKNIKPKPISNGSPNKCSICGNSITSSDFVTADKGKTLICKKCFTKLYKG